MACKTKFGPTLHVRTCRATVPDVKNGWTDYAQIWYTDRVQLLGCRDSHLEAPLRSSARAGLELSLARCRPQKASYLLLSYIMDEVRTYPCSKEAVPLCSTYLPL